MFEFETIQPFGTSKVLALGAFLKNRVCYVDGAQLVWSPIHGDLSTPQARAALHESVRAGLRGGGIKGAPWQPDVIVHDAHPQFYSTELAQTLARELSVPILAVQHHHAHIAAVCAEFGIAHDQSPVHGWALDGVGLGNDGHAWGGELLCVNGPDMQRRAHLQALCLAGGDKAAQQPWRMALAVCHAAQDWRAAEYIAASAGTTSDIVTALASSLRAGVWDQKPKTTAAGRWFDAAAALFGIAPAVQAEAEAAIILEQYAQRAIDAKMNLAKCDDEYAISVKTLNLPNSIELAPWLLALAARVRLANYDVSAQAQAALTFHYGLADALVATVLDEVKGLPLQKIILNGGCLLNRILRARLEQGINVAGHTVLIPRQYSCGDAAIALGQAWVGAVASP